MKCILHCGLLRSLQECAVARFLACGGKTLILSADCCTSVSVWLSCEAKAIFKSRKRKWKPVGHVVRIVHRRFAEHRARQNEYRMAIGSAWTDNDLIFASPDGGLLQPRNVLKRYYTLIKKAQVPRIRFHDLRHTHTTTLLMNDENVKVVSERLGHTSVSITLDTYHHVLPSMQRQAAKRIDDAYFGTSRNPKSEPISLPKTRRRKQA